MNVLHLFSNHKWTGPAEPALTLCAALRDQGVNADFACSAGPDLAQNRIVAEAGQQGLTPRLDMRLSKHRHPFWNWSDARKLQTLIEEHHYDILHTHLDNDHAIALSAARRIGAGAPTIVRSSYHGTGFPAVKRFRRLLASGNFVLEPSSLALEHDVRNLGLRREDSQILHGAIDLHRFNPQRELPDMRNKLAIPHDAFVVGIVARMQTHRRYEDLIDAAIALMGESDRVHFIVIGRGSKQEDVAYRPVRQHGLEDRMHLTGYLSGDEYIAAIKAFDVKVYLVPGSDGTCRAVREAMAMGKPVVASDRGMLPELVEDGETGRIFTGGEKGLTTVLAELFHQPGDVRQMGRNAEARARRDFDPKNQADQVRQVYQRLLATHPRKNAPE